MALLLLTQSLNKLPIFNAYISWKLFVALRPLSAICFVQLKSYSHSTSGRLSTKRVPRCSHFPLLRSLGQSLSLSSFSVLPSPRRSFADCLNRCLIVRQAVCLRRLMLRLAPCTRCTTFNDYHIWRIRNSGQKGRKRQQRN